MKKFSVLVYLHINIIIKSTEGKVFFWRVIFMSKKILILNGSPRLNGNTHALIEKFSEGAK